MIDEDVWEKRLKRELWTLHETACYFAGEEPSTIDEAKRQVLGDTKASAIYRDLKDARVVGTVHIIEMNGWWGHDRIKPSDAIRWGRNREHLAADAFPTIPAATQKSPEARKRSRADLLSAEIEQAIAEVGNDLAAVMGRLRSYAGKPGSCITEAGEGYVLWRDATATEQKLDRDNLRKRLTRRTNRGRQ